MKTPLNSSLTVAEQKARFDKAAKVILSDRQLLAFLLQCLLSEYRMIPREEIAAAIEARHTGNVSIIPGETNLSWRIEGMREENSILGEGTIYFDVIFHADVPSESVRHRIIINIEAQNAYYTGYPFIKRGKFYTSRMISSQHGTTFKIPEYENIQKVYSIWLCFNAPKWIGNRIISFHTVENDYGLEPIFNKEDYDLDEVVLVCLNEKAPNDIMPDEIHRQLCSAINVTFSEKTKVDKKRKILENNYKIQMEDNTIKELTEMCNLSEGIWEKGIAEGMEKGIAEGVEKGLAEGMEKVALKMLKKGSSDADILEMTEVSTERLKELKQQLLEPVQ